MNNKGKSIKEELLAILAAVRIIAPDTWSFLQQPPVCLSPQNPPTPVAVVHPLPDNPLVRDLQSRIYWHFYARGKELPHSQNSAEVELLLTRLRQANASRTLWENGWVVQSVFPDGRLQIKKGDRYRTALPGEYIVADPPGRVPAVNSQLTLRVPAESTQMQPGYFFSMGEHLADQYDEFNLTRFYFNVSVEGAPVLLHELSSQLNRFGVPYRYKCPTLPGAYLRADAAVLYVSRREYTITMALLLDMADRIGPLLAPETPMFCKVMVPGIGLAEEPGNGESFGMNRSRLVAEGLSDAHFAGAESVESRLMCIQRRFEANGLDLERPYLNPRSADLYDLPYAGGITL